MLGPECRSTEPTARATVWPAAWTLSREDGRLPSARSAVCTHRSSWLCSWPSSDALGLPESSLPSVISPQLSATSQRFTELHPFVRQASPRTYCELCAGRLLGRRHSCCSSKSWLGGATLSRRGSVWAISKPTARHVQTHLWPFLSRQFICPPWETPEGANARGDRRREGERAGGGGAGGCLRPKLPQS